MAMSMSSGIVMLLEETANLRARVGPLELAVRALREELTGLKQEREKEKEERENEKEWKREKKRKREREEEEERKKKREEKEAVKKEAKSELDNFFDVQLDRAQGQRTTLGLEWQHWFTHGCRVLKRLHPNSLAGQWNKRNGHRLVPGLLLTSVNDMDHEREIARELKEAQHLCLTFVREEAMDAWMREQDTPQTEQRGKAIRAKPMPRP